MVNFNDHQIRFPGLEVNVLDNVRESIKFDLELLVIQWQERMAGYIGYNAALFDQSYIKRMARDFLALIETFATDPGRHISELTTPDRLDTAGIAEAFNENLEAHQF
jgi:hypothetical protein